MYAQIIKQGYRKNKEGILSFIFTSASESPNFSMYVNVTLVHVTTTNWRSDRGVLALDVALLWIDQEIILAKSTQICKEDVRS